MPIEQMVVVPDTYNAMSERQPEFALRAQEKHLQREEDRRVLESGKLSEKELREQNGLFAIDANVDLSQSDF